jgi:outer membrane protein
MLTVALFLDATPAAQRVLHLSEAVDAGLKNQPSLKQAHAQAVVLEERSNEAKAPLLPQITGIASYQHRVGQATSAGSGGGGAPTALPLTTSAVDIYTFGGTATQLIWDFNQASEKYRAAGLLAASAQEQEKATAYLVAAGVRRAYFAARAQRALVGVASDTYANVEKHLKQTEGFVKAGTQPEIALAQTRTDLANAHVSVVNAENAYEVAKAQLAQQMGDPTGSDFDVAEEELGPVDGEDLPPETLAARAIAVRPEIAALERQKESNAATMRALKGGYGPSLSANAGVSETGTSSTGLGPAWNAGLTLSWPILQGGLTHAQVREAEANIDVTQAQIDTQKLQVRVDVKQASLSIRAAKATVKAAEDVVTNAHEQLRQAEGRFSAGVGGAIELGDAQVAATNADAQLVQARFNLSTARANLLASLGRP